MVAMPTTRRNDIINPDGWNARYEIYEPKAKNNHVIGIALLGSKGVGNECKGAYESTFSKVYQEPTFNGN